MNKEAKETKAGFETFLRRKLSIGTDPVKFAASLNNKMKKVAKLSEIEFDSLYDISDLNVLNTLKNAITTSSRMVYKKATPVNKWEEGIKWFIEFLSESSTEIASEDSKVVSRSSGYDEGVHIRREQIVLSRNRLARDACIQHYGYKCATCGIIMSRVYGELGEGFIEVHHLKPIHLFDEAHEVNPQEDLIPLCPNCHAMIHKLSNVGDLDKLKQIILKHRQ